MTFRSARTAGSYVLPFARHVKDQIQCAVFGRRLEAFINFSDLQRFPLEQAGFMNPSASAPMKYLSDIYIIYRRGIGAGTETPGLKATQRLL
jgi:hypothetical protein